MTSHCCCEEMRYFRNGSLDCVPHLSDEGIIAGCDDSFPVKIRFCPWCGRELVVIPTKEEVKFHLSYQIVSSIAESLALAPKK